MIRRGKNMYKKFEFTKDNISLIIYIYLGILNYFSFSLIQEEKVDHKLSPLSSLNYDNFIVICILLSPSKKKEVEDKMRKLTYES